MKLIMISMNLTLYIVSNPLTLRDLKYNYVGALTDATNDFLCLWRNGLEMCVEIKITISNDVLQLICMGYMYVFSSGL